MEGQEAYAIHRHHTITPPQRRGSAVQWPAPTLRACAIIHVIAPPPPPSPRSPHPNRNRLSPVAFSVSQDIGARSVLALLATKLWRGVGFRLLVADSGPRESVCSLILSCGMGERDWMGGWETDLRRCGDQCGARAYYRVTSGYATVEPPRHEIKISSALSSPGSQISSRCPPSPSSTDHIRLLITRCCNSSCPSSTLHPLRHVTPPLNNTSQFLDTPAQCDGLLWASSENGSDNDDAWELLCCREVVLGRRSTFLVADSGPQESVNQLVR